MNKVLLVDDSKFIQAVVKDSLLKTLDVQITSAYTLAETKNLLETRDFDIAIVDINLPDAANGEAIDLSIEYDVPVIVLTAGINKTSEEIILKKDILEYVTKSDPETIKYISTAVNRFLQNQNMYAMVVDSSSSSRELTTQYLEKLNINVIECKNGKEALDRLNHCEKDISLVITDYDMPKMDGLDLVKHIRQKYSKDKLSVIALSDSKKNISTKFLRHGANDFIKKPFSYEEFSSRVNINMELNELFKKIEQNSYIDYLTGLYNRRFFLENSTKILERSKRLDKNLSLVMIDIDYFKKINDKYGHDVGDIAIKEVGRILKKTISHKNIIARFGGEEFCILIEDMSLKELELQSEEIREAFEKNIIHSEDIELSYTVSIGVYFGLKNSVEKMIKLADECLYDAKNSGRNKVVIKH